MPMNNKTMLLNPIQLQSNTMGFFFQGVSGLHTESFTRKLGSVL